MSPDFTAQVCEPIQSLLGRFFYTPSPLTAPSPLVILFRQKLNTIFSSVEEIVEKTMPEFGILIVKVAITTCQNMN